MIVIDRTSIAPGRGKAAIEAASRFVSSLNRADRVALATIPQGPQVTFTADHELVQTLLQKVDGNAVPSFGIHNIGVADALAFERKDQFGMDAAIERECGVAAGGRGGGASDMLICMNEVKAEANLVAADVRNRARTSIDSLRVLIDSLPARETPTMLVLISEGLVIEREAGQLSWLERRRPLHTSPCIRCTWSPESSMHRSAAPRREPQPTARCRSKVLPRSRKRRAEICSASCRTRISRFSGSGMSSRAITCWGSSRRAEIRGLETA